MEQKRRIARQIEKLLAERYDQVENIWDQRPCFEHNGMFFKIAAVGGGIDSIIVEYADNRELADNNCFEDGDAFCMKDYTPEEIIRNVLQEIEKELEEGPEDL